jgi:hypothetical protein
MVSAIAPNAPIGAAWTTIRMISKNTVGATWIATRTGFPRSPINEIANPVRIGTWRISPAANALTLKNEEKMNLQDELSGERRCRTPSQLID